MEADCFNTPEAFAAANDRSRLEYLRSLTPETAAAALESHQAERLILDQRPTANGDTTNPSASNFSGSGLDITCTFSFDFTSGRHASER